MANFALRSSARQDLIEALREFRETRWLGLIITQYGLLNLLAIAIFNVIAPAILAISAGGAGRATDVQ